MKTRIEKFMVCVLALAVLLTAGITQAADIEWDGGGSGDLWSTPANWLGDAIPGAGDNAHLNVDGGVTLVDSTTNTTVLRVNMNTVLTAPTVILNMTGGSITDAGEYPFTVGSKSGTATVNLSGGVITAQDGFILANNGNATGVVNMTGGEIHVSDTFSPGAGWWEVFGIGDTGPGTFNMEAGTITSSIQIKLPARTGHGVLNMSGGSISGTAGLSVAYASVIEMTDGTIDIGGEIHVSRTGVINLHGSTMTGGTLSISESDTEHDGGRIDLEGSGTLIIDGDITADIDDYIVADSGGFVRMTANGGTGTVTYNHDAGANKTTIKALSLLNPIPADGDPYVNPDLDLLSWTLPSSQFCKVFYGETGTTPLPQVLPVPPATGISGSESVIVGIELYKDYTWTVEIYNYLSVLQSTETFTFSTQNAPPDPNAGTDVVTWLLPGGDRIVDLDGSYTPGTGPDPISQSWTVVTDANDLNPAILVNSAQLDAQVILPEAGSYTLQLAVSDNLGLTATDTMDILVYADACAHAADQPGFVAFPGDTVFDCEVNLADLAKMMEVWTLNYAYVE